MNDSVRLKVIAYLSDFSCEISPVKIDDNLTLREILKEESRGLRQHIGTSTAMNIFDAIRIKNVLEFIHEIPKGKPITIPSDILRDFITVLRINKQGRVGCPFISADILSGDYKGATVFQHLTKVRFGHDYILKADGIKILLSTFDKFKHIDFEKHKFSDIAIKRFNHAYESERIEDCLIDYTIAFEALFLKGNEDQELSYRLALRTAFLLKKEDRIRQDIFRDMRDAYRLRSLMVHGKSIKIIEKDLKEKYKTVSEFIYKIESYLRISMTLFLELVKTYSSQEEIIEYLDSKIFS